MILNIRLGNSNDLRWAQETVTRHHYLRRPVDPRARPMVYVVRGDGERLGLIMVGTPHATRNREWWGYPGLPTQWQVVDLCRIWLDPRIQRGGSLAFPGRVPGFTDRKGIFRPTVASWAMQQVLDWVQVDRISLCPPVLLSDPYHIRLVISYHDPTYHRGTIYREMGWQPMHIDDDGQPRPGSSGKFGWCCPLPQPAWSWQQIEILQPRTMRLPLEI